MLDPVLFFRSVVSNNEINISNSKGALAKLVRLLRNKKENAESGKCKVIHTKLIREKNVAKLLQDEMLFWMIHFTKQVYTFLFVVYQYMSYCFHPLIFLSRQCVSHCCGKSGYIHKTNHRITHAKDCRMNFTFSF